MIVFDVANGRSSQRFSSLGTHTGKGEILAIIGKIRWRTPKRQTKPQKGRLNPKKTNYFWGAIPWGTFLPPNGSISGIMGWYSVDPSPNHFLRLFHIPNQGNQINRSPKIRNVYFLETKKSPCGHARVVVRIGFYPKSKNRSPEILNAGLSKSKSRFCFSKLFQ